MAAAGVRVTTALRQDTVAEARWGGRMASVSGGPLRPGLTHSAREEARKDKRSRKARTGVGELGSHRLRGQGLASETLVLLLERWS